MASKKIREYAEDLVERFVTGKEVSLGEKKLLQELAEFIVDDEDLAE